MQMRQLECRGVDRAELLGGGYKQLKIPHGGGVGKGCTISYIFFGGGGGGSGQPGNPSGYTPGMCSGMGRAWLPVYGWNYEMSRT